MVVTRRMSKQIAAKDNRRKQMKNFKIRECFVKIQRLANISQIGVNEQTTTRQNEHSKLEYSLRSHSVLPNPENKSSIIKKKTTKIAKSTKKYTSAMWDKAKKRITQTPPLNSVVLSKMKGSSPWPSRLMSISNGKASVYFFGTDNHGVVPIADVLPFSELDFIVKLLVAASTKQYRKAVREAELCMGIPLQHSMLNSL